MSSVARVAPHSMNVNGPGSSSTPAASRQRSLTEFDGHATVSTPLNVSQRRHKKSLIVNVPDNRHFLQCSSSNAQRSTAGDPSVNQTSRSATEQGHATQRTTPGRNVELNEDAPRTSVTTPVTLPRRCARGSSPSSSNTRRSELDGAHASQQHDEDDGTEGCTSSYSDEHIDELNGGFGQVGDSTQQPTLGLGLGLGAAGEQVARRMRMDNVETLRARTIIDTVKQESLWSESDEAKSANPPRSPAAPRDVFNSDLRGAWDQAESSGSGSPESSPSLTTEANATPHGQNLRTSRTNLPPLSHSQTSLDEAASNSGTFVSVASGPLAQLASSSSARSQRGRGPRALITNLLSRSPRSGNSPRLESVASMSTGISRSPSAPTGWQRPTGTNESTSTAHAHSTNSSVSPSSSRTSAAVMTSTGQSSETQRRTPRSLAAATFSGISRSASAVLSASQPSSTAVSPQIGSTSGSAARPSQTTGPQAATPATIGLCTPVIDNNGLANSQPAPSLASLGLSVASLTQGISGTKGGLPLCGAILDDKYLLIGTTQGLDFLPLPTPGALSAANNGKRKLTRKPISLVKKTRFKDLAVLSERSNILLACAGRNDHVRVYALESVRALIRRKLVEQGRREGYDIMQDAEVHKRRRKKSSVVPTPAPALSNLPTVASGVIDQEYRFPAPSPPPHYDAVAPRRPSAVRRVSSRPNSWHQNSSSMNVPPSPGRPAMHRGPSGATVSAVPRNPRGSISAQGTGSAAGPPATGSRHVRGQKSREFVASRRGSTATVVSRRRSRPDIAIGPGSPPSMSRRSSYASVEQARRQSSAGFTLTPGTPSFESQNLTLAPAVLARQPSTNTSDSGWTTSNNASPCPPLDYFSQPVSPRTIVPPHLPPERRDETSMSIQLQATASSSTHQEDGLSRLPFPSRPRSTRAAPRRRPQSVLPRTSSDNVSTSARLLPRKPTTVASPALDGDRGRLGDPTNAEVLSLADIIRDGPPLKPLPTSTSAPQLAVPSASTTSVPPSSLLATPSSLQTAATPESSPTSRQLKRWTVGAVGSRFLNRSSSGLGEESSSSSAEESASRRRTTSSDAQLTSSLSAPSGSGRDSSTNGFLDPIRPAEIKRRCSDGSRNDELETNEPAITVDAHPMAATSALEYVKLARTKGTILFQAVETKKKTYLAVLCGDEGERIELFTGSRSISLQLNRTFVLPESPRNIELQLQGDDLADIYLLYQESIFAIEPSTVRVREVGVGRAERRARRERERRMQQANAAAVASFTESSPMASASETFLHPADPARHEELQDGGEDSALPVSASGPQETRSNTTGDVNSPRLLASRANVSRSSSLNRPLPSTPLLTDTEDETSATRTRSSTASKASLPYTTFQQLPFVPPVPSSVLSSAWVIPPLYTDVVTASPDPSNSRVGSETPSAADLQPPLLSPISLLGGSAPRGHGRPSLFFVSKGNSLSGIVTAEGKSVIKRPLVWTNDKTFQTGQSQVVEAPRRLELLVVDGAKTFVVSTSATEVKAIAVQGGVDEPSFTAAATANSRSADSIQWLGTHSLSSQMFFAERNGQQITIKCLAPVKN
ncbi:hypothetical protein OIO90_001240 [Microbotryomycetes sp. JL221]|nr:hypothetical protein OIO90_001240 [Microbotryomycetes sp. JL221]